MPKQLSPRVLTASYLVALVIIAALSIASHFLLYQSLRSNEGSAEVINITGRQRMLSQRIAGLALQWREGDRTAQGALQLALAQFEAAHESLTRAARDSAATEELRTLYFGPSSLDAKVKAFASDARRILNAAPDDPTVKPILSDLLAMARAPLLTLLDQVVTIHQKESERRLGALATLQFGILLVVLATLLFEALLIFRPMINRIIQYIAELLQFSETIEKQLVHVQRLDAIGRLTSGIAHDFNNVLSAVIGNLEVLEERLKNMPKEHEIASVALAASLQGADLTRQLLAFSRKETVEARTIDVNALVTKTVTMLRRTLGSDIACETRLAQDLWATRADPTQLESALTNMAINARDAMPKGGRITITTANERLDAQAALKMGVSVGDYVAISVGDTGTGIAPDILSKVFEPFFTTKPAGKGTGLGLAMILGFAKKADGGVSIQSEVGVGTTVRVFLPREQADVSIGEPAVARRLAG